MKKVRFETPTKLVMDNTMREYDCHSPRPFIDRQVINICSDINQPRPVVFTNDPVHRFENDNSLPYPTANKTFLNTIRQLESRKVPSSDLDLSMLDCSRPGNRISSPKINTVFDIENNRITSTNSTKNAQHTELPHKILMSIENKTTELPDPPNILKRTNDFFLSKENLGRLSFDPLQQQLNQFSVTKDDDPYIKKSQLLKMGAINSQSEKENFLPNGIELNNYCECHHCIKFVNHTPHDVVQHINRNVEHLHSNLPRIKCSAQACVTSNNCSCACTMHVVQPTCPCSNPQQHPSIPRNAVDKKTWAIEKYERTRESESSEVEKPKNVFKEKREPTVTDLFKIIKLQNEQLQLLQEKVDKFISSHNCEVKEKQTLPIHNYVSEQLAVQTVNSEQHKISIGVMTSFEMVRTSTVINKEIVKQSEAQIQCNRSQISIKEIVSKKQAGDLNFLDGISPMSKNMDQTKAVAETSLKFNDVEGSQADNLNEEKLLNELSLYNVQVDNATTPLMSPEQSLYLDIRDYSESDSGSDDQSNVGWTYYNKVMTHVNGMLQDSDMPSSASALYRHTKQKCVQMQIDKSNVSIAKRVTFGDDPFGVQQQYNVPPTDTSLKMNQLAAKYLKHSPASHTPSPRVNAEMSFATRNYMERHKLLQGTHGPIQQDIPRFLDITALKQQPKFI